MQPLEAGFSLYMKVVLSNTTISSELLGPMKHPSCSVSMFGSACRSENETIPDLAGPIAHVTGRRLAVFAFGLL